ncbi:alpha/beta fold hydrolase [Hahella sp. HN01]|uniref:alpha/beta fold hydrolase n=1 Tax=Hahella sp. HN01 TaxID=2847262 RepID=UPI001C1ECFAB|nr:alpha/beta hydrolase [Hahella sp. HN01]MBU6951195.1 alpha/beta hydrolase [Hahella sp. HN01]
MENVNYRQALIDKMGIPVTQNQVSAGKINTAYLSAGEGAPVICLHGAGAGAVTWYPSLGALSQHFHVIAPDIVGYGESDKPDAPYDRPYFSAWLQDFMAALAIPKAHIVGLSQGGAIALQFALDCPDKVDKLVLVDAAALGARPSLRPMVGMIWLNSFPSALANRFFTPSLLFDTGKRDPNHAHYSIEVLKRPGGKNPFTQGRGAAVAALPEEALRGIHNETLIIWGEQDQLFAIEHGEAAARLMPNAKLHRIPRAGHLPLMDQPALFNQALLDFLVSTTPTTAYPCG